MQYSMHNEKIIARNSPLLNTDSFFQLKFYVYSSIMPRSHSVFPSLLHIFLILK